MKNTNDNLQKKRGRPVAAPTETVRTRLPLPLYDQIAKAALRRDESIASVVRSLLITRIRRDLL